MEQWWWWCGEWCAATPLNLFSVQNCFLSLSIYELLACWLDSPRRGDHTPLFCTHLGPVFVDLIKARSRDEYRRSHSRDAHCNYVHTWIGKSAPSPALEPYPCRGARRGMYTLSLLDSTRHHHHHLHHSHRRHTPLSIYVKRCTIPIIPGRLFFGVITVRSKTASDAATCESVTGWHRPGGANYLIDLSHIFVALFWLNPNQPTHTHTTEFGGAHYPLHLFPFFNVDYLKCEKGWV